MICLRLMPFFLTTYQLLGQGLHVYTWKTVESADFVEHASYLVCDDLHRNLGVIQSNFREICNIAALWSENGQLDVFTPRDSSKSFSMDKLQEQHRSAKIYNQSLENIRCYFYFMQFYIFVMHIFIFPL